MTNDSGADIHSFRSYIWDHFVLETESTPHFKVESTPKTVEWMTDDSGVDIHSFRSYRNHFVSEMNPLQSTDKVESTPKLK